MLVKLMQFGKPALWLFGLLALATALDVSAQQNPQEPPQQSALEVVEETPEEGVAAPEVEPPGPAVEPAAEPGGPASAEIRAAEENPAGGQDTGNQVSLNPAGAREALSKFLGTVILGDEKQGLTVGKLLLAVLLLVFGLWLARRFTNLFRKLVLNRTNLDANAQFTLERLAHYALLALLVLIALSLLNIPLTLFAFMGGAIAIAAGLGGQNLLNNFMSGLILMGEKPIKISDIVEVDGRAGRVEMIGARSTRIRLFDGIQVLVPNSKLLENNVTNWTLSDKEIRLSVKVGVAYGTDAARVLDILAGAVASVEDILQEPEPAFLFEDFGDSALLFNVLFWVEIDRPMDGRRISSVLRQRIAQDFAEAGVVIAFPQRDLHLHAPAPIPLTWDRKGKTEKQED